MPGFDETEKFTDVVGSVRDDIDRADVNKGDCDSYRADRVRAPAALFLFYFNLVNNINKFPDRTV